MPDVNRQYPIGKFSAKDHYSAAETASNIERIEQLPHALVKWITNTAPSHLDTPYREGGWTARQVIHHLADSHLNAYVRTKWALTENTPLIKAYDEKHWALTPETTSDPRISVALLMALHTKWAILLKSLTPAELKKSFTHPETGKAVSIERIIALYAWHGEHHLAHLLLVAS